MERNALGQTEKEFLEAYDPGDYERPSNTVDILVFTVIDRQLSLLLIRRKDHPWINKWALPGGFVEIDEDLSKAAVRELKEEAGIGDDLYFRQLYTFGKADRDPRMRVITTAYMTLAQYRNIRRPVAGDDAAEAEWFTVSRIGENGSENERTYLVSLENKDRNIKIEYRIRDRLVRNYISRSSKLLSRQALAGDHIKIINKAMDELQFHVADSGMMFNLLPGEFTLKEAQDVYETITCRKKDVANFRRDIMKMLKATGKTVRRYNKEAALYRFNPMLQFYREDF